MWRGWDESSLVMAHVDTLALDTPAKSKLSEHNPPHPRNGASNGRARSAGNAKKHTAEPAQLEDVVKAYHIGLKQFKEVEAAFRRTLRQMAS